MTTTKTTTTTLPTMKWSHHNGYSWLLDNRDRPLVVEYIEDAKLEEIKLDLEQATGWKVDLKHLPSKPGSRRVAFVVYRLKVHQPIDREAYRVVPTEDRYHRPDLPDQFFNVAGIPSYSDQAVLSETWRDHPRGSTIVWTCGYEDRPGVLVVMESVGAGAILARAMMVLRNRGFVHGAVEKVEQP